MAILFNFTDMEFMMKNFFFSQLSTPIGALGIFANNNGIYRIEFLDKINEEQLTALESINENNLTVLAKKQLTQYFNGARKAFNLPLVPHGTPFRLKAWEVLQKIPYGETRYYSQQAYLMKNEKAVRAVGAANGANPIAIVIPCHRVIGKNGSLTGYAGGLHRKSWLLNLEIKTTKS